MPPYRLATDGDEVERNAYSSFLNTYFPAYELFWQNFVVPLTNRPHDIHFLADPALQTIGKTHADLCIAQLHYSILVHLNQTDVIQQSQPMSISAIVEAFVRLTGALDNAFELLERFTHKGDYDAWVELGSRGSKTARGNWQKNHSRPLQDIRDYRNSLVHGRVLPIIITGGAVTLPIVGKQELYLDWRLITDPKNNPGLTGADFDSLPSIVKKAFAEVCKYLEQNWRSHLLGGSKASLPLVPVPTALGAPVSGSAGNTTVSGMSN